jgi:hypothetical protein
MCFELLTNKFFILGLLIYWIPSIVVLGYALSVAHGLGGYYPGTEYSPTFEFFSAIIALLLLFIPGPILLARAYPSIMIPYFIIAYGLLYFYYRHEKEKRLKKKQCISTDIEG